MLRIGVLLDAEVIPSWAFEMLRRIEQATYAEIVVLVKNDAPGPAPRSLWNLGRKILANTSQLLYAVHERAERYFFSVSPDAFATKHI